VKNKIKRLAIEKHINRKKIWIFGIHAAEAALRNEDRNVYEIRCIESLKPRFEELAKERNIRLNLTDMQGLNKFLRHETHQGVAVYADPKQIYKTINSDTIEEDDRVVILDQLTDVNNIGNIMRSMLAMNFTAIITTKHNSPDLEKCAIKSACGAAEGIKFFEVANLVNAINILKKMDFWVIGLDHKAKQIENDFPMSKIAIVVGSEGDGIRSLVLKSCDELVCLNTNPDFPVLNASVACAICMYIINANG
jgi:23S rRNA (guanosine2251-2'-O)-methyltransferase